MNDRYRRGVEIIDRLCSGKLEQFLASEVAEIAPDFARMAIEFSFGDLYARDGLDLKSREIAAISALATRGDAVPQLRNHVRAALNLGLKRREIIEVLMQTAIFSGFPIALAALAACHDMLTEDACQAAS